MKIFTFAFTLVAVIMLFSTAAQANVVSIECEFPLDENEHAWSFDYDLQELTVTETFYDGGDWITLSGIVDSDSTFTVIETIINNTGVTWTGFGLDYDMGIGGGGWFVIDSFESTKLQTITIPGEDFLVEFSGPPPVLDGESFTIQYDFYVPYIPEGGFLNLLSEVPIPEPATLALLGLGGLALVRRHKRSIEL